MKSVLPGPGQEIEESEFLQVYVEYCRIYLVKKCDFFLYIGQIFQHWEEPTRVSKCHTFCPELQQMEGIAIKKCVTQWTVLGVI